MLILAVGMRYNTVSKEGNNMKIIVLGGCGFIGTNLIIQLSKNKEHEIICVDRDIKFFKVLRSLKLDNVIFRESKFDESENYNKLFSDADIVFHLLSTTNPTTSNQHISEELSENVVISSKILDACVASNVKRIIFMSSGGTVYGNMVNCPIKENSETNPINSYGLQKLMIEKLLYLYNYVYQLDYKIIRLSNPYGPYQRPNGQLGVITTFTYNALNNKELCVFGDGSVIRDYIYIDDAVTGILKIMNDLTSNKIYNLGSGKGNSIKDILNVLDEIIEQPVKVKYMSARKVDVKANYLDISKYESVFGKLNCRDIKDGIKETIVFLENFYDIRKS